MELKNLIDDYYGLSKFPSETSYAMAYVPFQQVNSKLFAPEQGLNLGTMYKDLNKPFYGRSCGDSND